jgi:hypothetical protein
MNLRASNIPARSGGNTITIMGKVQRPPWMVRAVPIPGETVVVPADARPTAH